MLKYVRHNIFLFYTREFHVSKLKLDKILKKDSGYKFLEHVKYEQLIP